MKEFYKFGFWIEYLKVHMRHHKKVLNLSVTGSPQVNTCILFYHKITFSALEAKNFQSTVLWSGITAVFMACNQNNYVNFLAL